MKDRTFFDTNILVYAFSDDDSAKRAKAIELLNNCNPIVSMQVLKELANVLLKKDANAILLIKNYIKQMLDDFEVAHEDVLGGLNIKGKYKLQFYDSLIIASVLEAKCNILFSEDMQDGQVIEGMRIINPFGRDL